MVRLGSGVRVEFETNSAALALTVLTSRTQTPEQVPQPCAFDLTVDCEFVATRLSDKGNLLQVDAARLAGVELCNLGLGGSCHMDQYVARTIRDLPVARQTRHRTNSA